MHVVWRVLQRRVVVGKKSSCRIAAWPKWLVRLRSAAKRANASPHERDLVHRIEFDLGGRRRVSARRAVS
jgi:hypothetical protein